MSSDGGDGGEEDEDNNLMVDDKSCFTPAKLRLLQFQRRRQREMVGVRSVDKEEQ